MKYTCGIFLVNTEGRFLVVHPTGAPGGFWSIPKGLMDANETPVDTAYREFKEETGLDLNKLSSGYTYKFLGTWEYERKNKALHAFCHVLTDDVELPEFYCDSIVDGKDYPEVDGYMWVGYSEGIKLLNDSQQRALNLLAMRVIKIEDN